MKKNTGKQYEKLVQHIYQQIVNSDTNRDIETINVQHNINLKGKTTSHQIDVYWKFLFGREVFSTIIQAKDWSSKVPKKEMLAFQQILEDLPSGTKGIFIAKNGFQSGAIEVAQANGISLYTLRATKDEKWNGEIPLVTAVLDFYIPFYYKPQFQMPLNWAKENQELAKLMHNLDSRSLVVDNETKKSWTVEQLIAESCDSCGVPPKDYVKEFNDAYMEPYGTDYKIKIKEFSGVFGYQTSHREKIEIQVDQLVGYILRDVTNGKIEIFDDDKTLLRSEEKSNG